MESVSADASPIEFAGIRCSAEQLLEIDSGRVMVLVSRPDILRIAACHGLQALHPIIQFVAGVIVTAIGLIPVPYIIGWIHHGGTLILGSKLLLVLAPIGLWLIAESFARGYFLRIETTKGSKRLAFHGKPRAHDVEMFLQSVENRFGYKIEREIATRRNA
ncbi:MAG TPA: hypothetical protein VFC78_05010 [Tepidisphaeraceae bacterium]|nr:hypothetical protein [Tepidisphaeraceae bacterium]